MMDLLALEALIAARVKAQVAGLVDVVRVADAGQISAQQAAKRSPIAIVAFEGDSPAAPASGLSGHMLAEAATNQTTVQRFSVALVVRNAREVEGGTAAREEVGPLLSATILALAGWTPDPTLWAPLVRVSAGAPQYLPGLLIYPLGFEARIVLTTAKLTA